VNAEPRTAIVNVFVTKPLQIDEPSWCAGHQDDRAQYKVDLTHDGPEHVIAPGGRELFRASLTQAPFASVDRSIGLYVEVADLTRTYTPAEVEQLADDLIEAAAHLRGFGYELAALLGGEPQ
jgi:phosphoglycolate phosphatase-like HAD superfamily hydrolase